METNDQPFFLYVPYNAPHYPMHAFTAVYGSLCPSALGSAGDGGDDQRG
ncbi:MAG: hypothetical protein R2932_21165 [Caldilineaceae bacterium]